MNNLTIEQINEIKHYLEILSKINIHEPVQDTLPYITYLEDKINKVRKAYTNFNVFLANEISELDLRDRTNLSEKNKECIRVSYAILQKIRNKFNSLIEDTNI